MLTEAKLGCDVSILTDMEIIVMDIPSISLEFEVGVVYAGCVLTALLADVLAVVISDVVSTSTIDVDMSADENASGLAAEVALSEP